MNSTSYSNIGNRHKNEDAFYESENLYIVCDGVGGAKYGEVASKLACSSFADYFQQNPSPIFDATYLQSALRFVVQQFREIETKYPETKGMATTIVLIAFYEDGAIVGWMGDSRLYHICDEKILFATEDDSLINEMKRKGEDPKNVSRNFITKALNANCVHELSFHYFSKEEIQQSDFFLLCTDGVLENITEQKISNLFSINSTIDTIQQHIIAECKHKTQDNYTFLIIQAKYP